MNKLEEKTKSLLEERETILTEMSELKKAFDIRQQRLLEIAGSIKTLQELAMDDEKKDNVDENDINTTKK